MVGFPFVRLKEKKKKIIAEIRKPNLSPLILYYRKYLVYKYVQNFRKK